MNKPVLGVGARQDLSPNLIISAGTVLQVSLSLAFQSNSDLAEYWSY